MATETSTTKQYKPSPAVYKKSTIKSNYMTAPCNGMIVGRVGKNKGKLILAVGMINKIRVLDPDTGKVLQEYDDKYGCSNCTDDVTEGPDGTLYFTRLVASDKIGYIRPDGTHGNIQAVFWNNSIVVTRDGKWLYFGCCGGNDQIWRYKLESNGLPAPGAKPELIEEGGGWPNSMEEGGDGFIYSVSNLYGKIRKINIETNEITEVFDNLEFPSSIEINDEAGVVYTSEFHLGYVSRIDLKIKDPRKAKRVIAKVPPCLDNVAVMDGPQPRIFASSFVEDIVFEAKENGDMINILSHGGMMPSSIQIVRDPKGDRYFIKEFGRVREWFPAENRYDTLAWANFRSYFEDKTYEQIPYVKPPD
jgi:hypothetical protein